jgi:mannan endo-1,4-beta-mannosidase
LDPIHKEMSDYIKSLDQQHLVAMGDEGFTCNRYQVCGDTTCDCYYGVDSNNITKLPSIDFMSLHLYPDQWGKQVDWATDYITNHSRSAHSIGKPALLGEYGWKNNQDTVYAKWAHAIESSGMNGGTNLVGTRNRE